MKKRRCSYFLFYLFLCLFFYSSISLSFVSLVYDPYDVVQNTITAKNSVQALINQAKQLQFETDNLKKLSSHPFTDTMPFLNQVSQVANQGQALSYGQNSETAFKNKFPGSNLTQNYHEAFAAWSGTTSDTLKNAISVMALQGKEFNQEHHTVQDLQALSENTNGNLSALQTSHHIQLEEIAQLQKLKQILMTQSCAENTFMAYQLQKDQATESALHEWIKASQVPFKWYASSTGFGVEEIPSP